MLLMMLISACLVPFASVFAQTEAAQEPSQCVSCHQDLYLYYDSGKSYCLCDTQVSCEDCHHGDPQAITAEAGHIGMIARPACAQTNTCKDCHPSDYQDYIDEFATLAGIHATPCPLPDCEHRLPEQVAADAVPECTESTTLPWRDIAAGVLGVLSIGLVALAVYLYKS